MNQKKINFAIIGYGRIAERHAEHITKMGNLIAACDKDETRRELFRSKFNKKCYSSIDELLEKEKDIDVVAVCTPNGSESNTSL